MPYIKTKDDVSLFYKDWGGGKPVVFVHGWPLNADMWEYQMAPMARQGLRCIAYDRRGFGRSEQPDGGYDYDTFADDLQALLDGLDLHDVTLVGFSMGGGEIARYLARHGSARIAKAVLVASVVPFLLKTPDHPDGADRGIFDGMVAGLETDRPHFLTGVGKQFFGSGLLTSPVSSEVLEWNLWMAMQASPIATIDCVRAFSETDFRPDLAAFTIPTLVIHGSADQTVPAGISGKVAAAGIKGAIYKEYEGAPHGLFMTEKDRLTLDLLEFIRS
jgi:pimeloyl-ACP methyl ester carboxylesterase